MICPSVQTYPNVWRPNLPDIDCSWFYFRVWSQSFVVFGWIWYFVIDCFQLFHAIYIKPLWFCVCVNYILVAMTVQWAQKPKKTYSDGEEVKDSLMWTNWFREYTSRIINYPGHMARVFRIMIQTIRTKIPFSVQVRLIRVRILNFETLVLYLGSLHFDLYDKNQPKPVWIIQIFRYSKQK